MISERGKKGRSGVELESGESRLKKEREGRKEGLGGGLYECY